MLPRTAFKDNQLEKLRLPAFNSFAFVLKVMMVFSITS